MLIVGDTLKLADLGSCRGIYSKQPYTEYISTRWYRPPECLLTDGYYNYKMDIWGAGCVMFEITSLSPLFPGTNELDQVHKIHNVMGTPSQTVLDRFQRYATHMVFDFPYKEGTGIDRLIPFASPECIDIIRKMLVYDPDLRFSARKVLKHPFFRGMHEADMQQSQNLLAVPVGPPRRPENHGNSSKNLYLSSAIIAMKRPSPTRTTSRTTPARGPGNTTT